MRDGEPGGVLGGGRGGLQVSFGSQVLSILDLASTQASYGCRVYYFTEDSYWKISSPDVPNLRTSGSRFSNIVLLVKFWSLIETYFPGQRKSAEQDLTKSVQR